MDDLLAIVKEKYIKPPFSITLGENGSVHVTENSIYTSPTYFSKPIDTTGAGDAFFALSSVLTYMKVPDILIPFLSNIFAGLKTNITGNEKPVDKIDFIKSIRALLG
jgi:bifunctional ADP-heptose synthase (sugar kinase/adenylyltransferase)